MTSRHTPPIEVDIQLLAARVSTKGNYAETAANPSGEEYVIDVVPKMGLYVQCHHCTCLVALGKVYNGASTICNVAYEDDVIRVSVEKVYNSDAQVAFPTSKTQYV